MTNDDSLNSYGRASGGGFGIFAARLAIGIGKCGVRRGLFDTKGTRAAKDTKNSYRKAGDLFPELQKNFVTFALFAPFVSKTAVVRAR